MLYLNDSFQYSTASTLTKKVLKGLERAEYEDK